MSTATAIEWTDATWNPTRGCALVSPGCENCYAMRVAHRFSGEGQPYAGLTRAREKHGPVWTGEVRLAREMLGEPLRWRKPRRVFVNSMSDLFHERLSNEEIAAVFGVMAAAPQHTFQVLTKRAERMREWFEWIPKTGPSWHTHGPARGVRWYAWNTCALDEHNVMGGDREQWTWPLPNVWLGVSVEDQQRADERIPHLLDTPAAVRFVSAEPLLGPVDLKGWGDDAPTVDVATAPESWTDYQWPEWVPAAQRKLIEDFWAPRYCRGPRDWLRDHVVQQVPATGARVTFADEGHGWLRANKMAASGTSGRYVHRWNNIGCVVTDDGQVVPASGGSGSGWLSRWLTRSGEYRHKLNWLIVGGESGPGARPFDLAWARSLVGQCRAAGVPCFVKQLGAKPIARSAYDLGAEDFRAWDNAHAGEPFSAAGVVMRLRDRKGGAPEEWPEDLRVREWPEAT